MVMVSPAFSARSSPSYKYLQVSIPVHISDSHAIVELGGVVVVVWRKDGLGYSWEHGLWPLSHREDGQEQNQPQQHPYLKGETHYLQHDSTVFVLKNSSAE